MNREKFAALFRGIHPKFSRLYAKMLNEIGLSFPQYMLLNQLALLGAISMTEISDRLGITKPAVTNLVDRLEKKKYLRRLPHPKDRRISLLEILPKGRHTTSQIQAQSLDIILKAYDQYNETERKIISQFYSTLSEVVDTVLNEKRR